MPNGMFPGLGGCAKLGMIKPAVDKAALYVGIGGFCVGMSLLSGYDVTYVDDYWQEERCVILIVEDHQIVRDGMRRIVADVLPGVVLEVLEATTLNQARQIIADRKEDLDLVLLDIGLPDASGMDEVNCLYAEWGTVPVVVVSACEDWGLAADFLKAGALGFIPKSSNLAMMISALRLVLSGGRYFPPQVLELLTDARSGGSFSAQILDSGTNNDDPHAKMASLSPRQAEVLELMLQGRSNKEIARAIGVSVGTAKNYVAAILRAFNASSRAKAMAVVLADASHDRRDLSN